MLLMILSELVKLHRVYMLPLICVGSLTRVVKDCC